MVLRDRVWDVLNKLVLPPTLAFPKAPILAGDASKFFRAWGRGVDLSQLLELDLIGAIYDAVLEPALWAETLDRIRGFIQLQNAMLSVNALPSGDMLVHATCNIPDELVALTPELGEHAVALWAA